MLGPCPLVSVVILSYNRPQFLIQALQSIREQCYPHLEIIVIDNLSRSSAFIRNRLMGDPDIQLVSMPCNAGYTGGVNEGIRRSRGKYIYVTEDDMVTQPDAIAAMVDYMEQDSQAAIATGAHFDDCGTLICAGGSVTLGAVFSQVVIGRDTPVVPPLRGPFCATYATGAMMLLRRSPLEETGAFRDDFFMYFEDVEICARMMRLGWTVVVVPRAKAMTLENSQCPQEEPVIAFHKMKNFFITHLLHAPLRTLPEFILRYSVWNMFRSVLSDHQRSRMLLKANLWVAVRMPFLLQERWKISRKRQFEPEMLAVVATQRAQGSMCAIPEVKQSIGGANA